MSDQSSIASQMIAQLAIVEPDLDTSVGTTIRKMIDVVAEQNAEAYADNNISQSWSSIDSLSGTALDDFTANFGFTRFQARAATGVVTFQAAVSQSSTPNPPIFIPAGTTVGTSTSPQITFVTTIGATLPSNTTAINVPIIAVTPAAASNVTAGAITSIVTPIGAISNIVNSAATTGGADAESDSAYIARFKSTVFRGFLGTIASFNGTVLENPNVARAVTIGAKQTHTEQIQIVSGTAVSEASDVKYLYVYNQFLQNSSGNYLTPNVDYEITASTGTAPLTVTLTSLNSVTCPDGIYQMQYDYLPIESRNDVVNGITNKVDIYTDGQDVQSATQIVPFFNNGNSTPTSSTTNALILNSTPTSALYHGNYIRSSGTLATASNLLIPLANTPVTELPSTISATFGNGGSAATYVLNTDYWIVTNISNSLGQSNNSVQGIEWLVTDEYDSVANNYNASDNSILTITYNFNALPLELSQAVGAWGFTNLDVWVHQATAIYLNFYLVVILANGQTSSSVQSTVSQAISSLVNTIPLGGILESSQVLGAVIATPGIQAVRFATSSDNSVNYAMQSVSSTGVLLNTYASGASPARVIDIILPTTSYLVYNNVNLTIRSQNSYRTGA